MEFKPFKMAQVSADMHSAHSPKKSLQSLHSSNPEPFSWEELHELIGLDLDATVKQSPLGYASTQGGLKVRELINQQYHSNGISAEDVVLTSGAQEGIFLVMHALLKPNDQVICFSPCFEPLFAVAEQAGAQVSLLPLDAENHWQIDWQQLEATINHNTRLLVINFPHNPTGTHISSVDQQRLINLCEKNDCWLFSDEVFRGLEHEPAEQIPAAADLYSKAISMGVMSKSLALPGIRVGWLTLKDHALRQHLMTIKSHLSICQSSVDTQLCQAIIPYSKLIWQRNRDIISHNKKWLIQHLNGHAELYWQTPRAAATGFIQLKTQQAPDLANYWAKEYGFMVMPDAAFMTSQAGFRLTLGKRNAEQLFQQMMQVNPQEESG